MLRDNVVEAQGQKNGDICTSVFLYLHMFLRDNCLSERSLNFNQLAFANDSCNKPNLWADDG